MKEILEKFEKKDKIRKQFFDMIKEEVDKDSENSKETFGKIEKARKEYLKILRENRTNHSDHWDKVIESEQRGVINNFVKFLKDYLQG